MAIVLIGIGITLSVIAIILAATSGLKSVATTRVILAGVAFVVASALFQINGGAQTAAFVAAAGTIAVSFGAIRHVRHIRSGA